MKNKKQSKSESKSLQIPMPVTDETIRDYGIDPKDIVWKRIGNRNFKVVLVDATEAEYKAYMDPTWSELKRKEREGRCLIPGKNGRLVRCPESEKCNDCDRYAETCKEKNRPASLQFLIESAEEPVMEASFEDDIIYKVILEELIAMLNEINPVYGTIFHFLYDGVTQQDMADELGMKQRTISDYIKQIRKIIRSLIKDTDAK